MSTALTGNQVGSAYLGILKTSDTAILNGSLRTVSDGGGNDSALQVSTSGVKSTGTMAVDGATTLTGTTALVGVATFTATPTGAGITALLASPPAIGGTTPAAGAFTTLSATTPVAIASGGTGANSAATARTALGVTATGADTTYAFRANNLSDLANASTARTNLGLGALATQSRVVGSGSTPGIVAGAVAGSGPTVSITGTDQAGRIAITYGTSPGTNGVLVTVTFASAYASAPYVSLTPSSAAAASTFGLQYVTSTTTGFVINYTAPAQSSGVQTDFFYSVIG